MARLGSMFQSSESFSGGMAFLASMISPAYMAHPASTELLWRWRGRDEEEDGGGVAPETELEEIE